MAEFSANTLVNEAEWWRAYVILTFLSQAYIWAEGEAGVPGKLPQVLAVPYHQVSKHFSMPAAITYSATVLHNWGIRDPTVSIDNSNLYALVTFTGSQDESWFYTTHVMVERAAVQGLNAVAAAYEAMLEDSVEQLIEELRKVQTSLQGMQRAAKKMHEGCSPSHYYTRVRQFLAGTVGLSVLPNGIEYEGVGTPPIKYYGSSASQSTAIQAFDVFLGVEHTGTDKAFLDTMQLYMPKKCREFLTAISHLPSLRGYVKKSASYEVVKSYNAAIQALASFRSEHIILATRYILSQTSQTQAKRLDGKGTGGTDFVKFLKTVRDDTLALKLD